MFKQKKDQLKAYWSENKDGIKNATIGALVLTTAVATLLAVSYHNVLGAYVSEKGLDNDFDQWIN